MTFVRRYPIAMPLLWLSLGIWVGSTLSSNWGFVACWGAAAMAWLVCLSGRIPELAFPCLLLCAGAARLQLSITPWSPQDLRHLMPPTATLATLRGTLLETPITRTTAGPGKTRAYTRTLLEVQEIQTGIAPWRSVVGKAAVIVSGQLPSDYFAGCRVELTGVLEAPAKATTPNAFDHRSYLERQDIYFEFRTEGTNDWKRLPSPSAPHAPYADRFQTWARRILSLGFTSSDPSIDLLCAMTVGWKEGLDAGSQDPFMKSGTLHVFAISGLHIALIAMIGIEGLRVLGLPRPLAGSLALPLIWLYTGLTGWQSSAIRSAVMMSVVAGGWMLNRPGNLLNNLSIAAVALLCWDPQQLFQPGFQLSFCVVAHLGLLSDVANRFLEGLRITEPYLPTRLQPPWRRTLQRGFERLKPHLATSAAAWLGSAPLMAHYFHILSPLSLVANLVVVPLSSLALASCIASLLVGSWFPSVAELFNHSSWLLMNAMVQVSVAIAKLPGAWCYVPSPGWLGFLIYFSALAFYLLGWFEGAVRRRRQAWTVLTTLLLVAGLEWVCAGNDCQLTLLSRKGGATLWLDEGIGRQKWLLDPGDPHEVMRVTMPFLVSEGINNVPNLLLTHASMGQTGGAEAVEQGFSVYRRFVPRGLFRSPSFRRFLETNVTARRHLATCGYPDRVGSWEVLSPLDQPRTATAADDAVLVLRGSFDGCRVLWLPKSSIRLQDQILVHPSTAECLEAEVVIAGIPAKGEFLPASLLEKINPQWIVVLDSDPAMAGRITPELRDRLQRSARRVLYSSLHPTLRFRIRRGRAEVIRPSFSSMEE